VSDPIYILSFDAPVTTGVPVTETGVMSGDIYVDYAANSASGTIKYTLPETGSILDNFNELSIEPIAGFIGGVLEFFDLYGSQLELTWNGYAPTNFVISQIDIPSAVFEGSYVPIVVTVSACSINSASLGSDPTMVTLSGTVDAADANGPVAIFDGPNQIGTATANSAGAWTTTVSVAPGSAYTLTAQVANPAGGTTSNTVAVDGDVITQTNSDGSELISTFNIVGQLFARDATTYTASSQLVSAVFYAANGSVYFDYAGPTTVSAFETYQAALDLVPRGFVISDSAKDVSGDFDALNADAHLTAITLTDAAPELTLTAKQALDVTAALHAITNANYHIDIVDTASDLGNLLNTQIATLASEGVTELTASDASVNYNGQQTAAILAAGLTVAAPANDKVVEAQAIPLDNYSYFFGPTGALSKFATYHADKTSEIYYYTGGTYGGIAYVNSDVVLNAAGSRETVKFYSINPSNPSGPLIVLVSLNYKANGDISVDFFNDAGVLLKQQNDQGSVVLDTRRYTPGSAFGISYASYDVAYASGKVTARTYYDGSGDVLETQTFTLKGYTLTSADGTETYSKAVDSDGDYETGYYGDTKAGQAFESNQFDYNSSGVKIANSFDTQTGNGQLNLIGDGLVATTKGTVGPTAEPGDFTFTPHTTGETYNFLASATNDVVDFTTGFGTAIVKGFTGTNAACDVLNLSSLFTSLSAAVAATTVLPDGNTTTTHGSDLITLLGVTTTLSAQQMGFV